VAGGDERQQLVVDVTALVAELTDRLAVELRRAGTAGCSRGPTHAIAPWTKSVRRANSMSALTSSQENRFACPPGTAQKRRSRPLTCVGPRVLGDGARFHRRDTGAGWASAGWRYAFGRVHAPIVA
jgi:hypothetical protein